ncbi:MAG: Pr6Pr family membrane protein [Firmicutes bacterium]|nr:Pr6Pr family membrane protein [Bacillota bacterium]MCL1954085.1 Pr6Pr family membrane protein [Bacillota bacterium]
MTNNKQLIHRIYLCIGAILILIAVTLGMYRDGAFEWGTLRYFTYLSNILLAIAFVVLAVVYNFKYRHYLMFAVTLAIVVTGLVYNLLLVTINGDKPITSDFTNFIIHFVAMIWAVVNYLVFETKGKLTIRHMIVATIFPFCYWIVFIVAGYLVADRWYPYFFMDTVKNNFGVLLMWLLALLVAFIALGSLIIWFDKSKNKEECKNRVD